MTRIANDQSLIRVLFWALLCAVGSNELFAATVSVAGVVVDGADGSRVGGARVGLYTDLQLKKGPWAQDVTSQSGVYSIVLENLVGDAPRLLYIAYYGAGTERVANPIELYVDPSRGPTIREKPGDLVLLSTAEANYESAEAKQRLAAIARTSELLSRADPEAREERAYLRKAAQEVQVKAAVSDPIDRDRLAQFVGRVELANRLGAAPALQKLEFLEGYVLAGKVTRAEGVSYELTADSWEKVKGGAKLHNEWPQLHIQIRGADDENEAKFLQNELVRFGADPNRIRVMMRDGPEAGPSPEDLAFAFEEVEEDG